MSYDPARRRAAETRDQLSEMKKSIDRGEAPKNEQLKHFLDQGSEVLEGSKSKVVDPEGKKVVEHTQEVLGSMKDFLETRNQDEVLQRIGQKAARLLKETSPTGTLKGGISKEDRKRAKQIMIDTRGVLRILVTSGNFRHTILSLFSILSDISTNLRTSYKEENKYPEELRMEPGEKIEESIDKVTKEMSQKKLDELEDRVHRLLQEIGRSQPLRNFMNHFYSITAFVRCHSKAFEEGGVQKSTTERYLVELIREIQNFLSQFTDQEVLKNIGQSTKSLLKLSHDDENFRVLGQEWKEYIDTSIRNPDFVMMDENKQHLRKLVQRTRYELEQPKVADPVNNFIKSVGKLVNDIQNDPVRTKLEDDVRTLFRDILFDDYGRFSLNQRALNQIRTVIIPSILDQLRFIAIPKIHSVSNSQEFTVRDIFVSVPDIMPEKIHIENKTVATMETKKIDVEDAHSTLFISLSDIELHIRNALVHFKRFSFPKVEDNLIVNTDVYGPATLINLIIHVDKVTERGITYIKFTPGEVDTKLDNLKIKAIEGKHDTLMNVLATVLNPLIKTRIQKQVSQKIFEAVERTCGILNDTSRQTLPRFMSRKESSKSAKSEQKVSAE